MNFIKDIFEPKYFNKLDKRKYTFKKMFQYLESLEKEKYNILETGICRIEDNFAGDGMSSLMFDEFVNYYDGQFTTVDINPENVAFAKTKLSERVQIVCSDSVSFLYNLGKNEKIESFDLIYLDSFDLEWSNPHPSSMHHIKELLAITTKIKEGTLLVVDDNNKNAGKGRYIAEYMKDIGKDFYFDDYQIGWIF